MKYSISYKNPSAHYIDFRVEIDNLSGKEVELQFPAWRPGRYELGNFAKNVRGFHVFDNSGKRLVAVKTAKDKWLVTLNGAREITVCYAYYAFELNAGSTYLDESQLYINPVNCFIYVVEQIKKPHVVELDIPSAYRIASGLEFTDNKAQARDYHELADSPFIASDSLQHRSFDCENVLFHLWFQGECKIDWDRVIRDFKGYTRKQIEAFGEFPVSAYHYLFQITPYKTYHGVEHQNSTVIALGPAYDLMTVRYDDLLGVCSHELYHTWNVKAIRPVDMYPYDYSRENYSRLGYVAEGVTTYLGDIFLLKGKVFTIDRYLKEITARVQGHFDNPGRFSYSVADSSYDTWLDGYVPGTPGRKVSIYTEGCLLAFILDVTIMRHTDNQKTLHDLMRLLYERFAKSDKGYSEADYKNLAEEVCGTDLTWYFNDYVNGTRTLEGLLCESLDYLGLELIKLDNQIPSAGKYGFRLSGDRVISVAAGSPAEMAGISQDDKIIAVNRMTVNGDTDSWLGYFKDDQIVLTLERAGILIEKLMPQVDQTFNRIYKVSQFESPSRPQREAFNKWSSKKS